MNTPFLDHIKKNEYDNVYEPAEDSFFMLDAIESDLNFIENELKPIYCLEVGSGSGIISTALAKRINNCFYITTDINFLACNITKRTSQHNNIKFLDAIHTNLMSGIRSNIFDIILFNPPYVVTEQDECDNRENNLLSYTWAGGINGRSVIDKFIAKLNLMLSQNGVTYLLLLKENKPNNVIDMLKQFKLIGNIFMDRRIRGEHLFIIKITKDNF